MQDMWHLSFKDELICVELSCHGTWVIDKSLDPGVGTLQRLMPLFSLRTIEILLCRFRFQCLHNEKAFYVFWNSKNNGYWYLGDADWRVYSAHSSTYNFHCFTDKIDDHQRFWSTSTLYLVVQTASHQNASSPSPTANSSTGAIKKHVCK